MDATEKDFAQDRALREVSEVLNEKLRDAADRIAKLEAWVAENGDRLDDLVPIDSFIKHLKSWKLG